MKTVLLVDDEESQLYAITMGFKALSGEIRILTSENGKNALGMLKREVVDIVITDLGMPVMDGFDLVLWIRFYYPSIRIMVLTAYCQSNIERELRQLVSNRILFKPISFDCLIKIVFDLAKSQSEENASLGIPVMSLLNIVEMRKRTCSVEVFGEGGKKGRIDIKTGSLCDAVCNDKTGIEALEELKQLKNIRIKLSDWPDDEAII